MEESKKIRGAKKVAALLAEHRDDAMLARKLVTIDCEVPLDLGPEDFAWQGIDEKALSELLRELEFNSLLQELTPSEAAIPVRAGEELEVTEETLPAALEELEARAATIVESERECDRCGATENFRRRRKPILFDTHLIGRTAPLLNEPSPPKEVHDLKTHLRKLSAIWDSPRGRRLRHDDRRLPGQLGQAGADLSDLYHEHLGGTVRWRAERAPSPRSSRRCGARCCRSWSATG